MYFSVQSIYSAVEWPWDKHQWKQKVKMRGQREKSRGITGPGELGQAHRAGLEPERPFRVAPGWIMTASPGTGHGPLQERHHDLGQGFGHPPWAES